MKYLPVIAGILLGLPFAALGTLFLLNLLPQPPAPPADSLPGHFMAAFIPSGYMQFVKVFEVIGGVLVMIPRTRNLGLLVLGPIILNILAFHLFITKGADLFNPMMVMIVITALYLVLVERKAFAFLLTRPG